MEKIFASAVDLTMMFLLWVGVFLSTYLKRYVVEKIALIKDEKVQNITMNALSRADDLAEKVVKKLQQTVVNDFKEKSKDGKLTKDEIREVSSKAKRELELLMNDELYTSLEKTVGDVNLYMQNLIESKVLDLKKDFITVNDVNLDFLQDENSTEASIV